MISRFNFEEVKKRYKSRYREAVRNRHFKLPYYEIQQWDNVLDPVASKLFDDIKCMGLTLYPIYPISEIEYLHFANPFNKVGIEIVYKNSNKEKIKRKIEAIISKGWTIYEIDSRHVYYTFQQYYEFIFRNEEVQFDEMNTDDQSMFIEQHKEKNAGCLLEYIKERHFCNYNYGSNKNGTMTIVECLKLAIKRYDFVEY